MSSWKKKPIEKKKAPEMPRVAPSQDQDVPESQNDGLPELADRIFESNAESAQSSQDNPDPAEFEDLKATITEFGRNIQADYREHPKFSKFKKGKA